LPGLNFSQTNSDLFQDNFTVWSQNTEPIFVFVFWLVIIILSENLFSSSKKKNYYYDCEWMCEKANHQFHVREKVRRTNLVRFIKTLSFEHFLRVIFIMTTTLWLENLWCELFICFSIYLSLQVKMLFWRSHCLALHWRILLPSRKKSNLFCCQSHHHLIQTRRKSKTLHCLIYILASSLYL
jgi:hypothetical protein